MKPQKAGYRVAVVGASSLLGKELLGVLEERHFPVSRLVTFEAEDEEPDLPIVDLREGSMMSVEDRDVSAGELDFAFLAGPVRDTPGFLASVENLQKAGSAQRPCVVIDLTGEGEIAGVATAKALSVPFLDRRYPAGDRAQGESALCISAHPAVIGLSTLLLRLAARMPIRAAVAHLFGSASESGARGIEELQRQTVNLLSFQKIPQQVFGAQLAFNLLSRLGHGGSGDFAHLENRLRQQLRQYLGTRVPLPALRLFQAPVFHSLGLSLYVETGEPVEPEAVAAALAGERVRIRRASQEAPSQVEATGSDEILVDSVTTDAAHPNGIWIWAVVDNIHLAAVNAVEIAESLQGCVRVSRGNAQ
jgi:aspartate-semialdehyde dehydrogenase